LIQKFCQIIPFLVFEKLFEPELAVQESREYSSEGSFLIRRVLGL
jgi:hypothetical protein